MNSTTWTVYATGYSTPGTVVATYPIETIAAPSRYAAVNVYADLYPPVPGERSRATRSVQVPA